MVTGVPPKWFKKWVMCTAAGFKLRPGAPKEIREDFERWMDAIQRAGGYGEPPKRRG